MKRNENTGKENCMRTTRIFHLPQDIAATSVELTRFDRIVLHLHCLYLDHKYRWHLAGVWRELLPSSRKQPISPATA